jgi:hypothetical protein
MEMKELLDGLSAHLGIDSLAIVGGEAALDIDGMPVLIAEAEEDALLVSGLVGDPPPEGGAEFGNLMLEANAGFFDTAACALARNPESGCYMLLERFAKASLDPESFARELAAFADTLGEWRETLESFRPAAAAAAETKRSDAAIRFSPDGFIEA